MKAVTAMVVLLGLASVSNASDSLFEQAVWLEEQGRGVQAVKVYRQAARAGDGKAAKRLSEIYRYGIDGVRPDFQDSLYWAQKAQELGEPVPVRPYGAGPPPPPSVQPLNVQRGIAPRRFEFRMAFMPRVGSDQVEFRRNGLVFESYRHPTTESVTVMPSDAQWRAFRESLDRLNVWQWRPEYRRPILDGTGWSLNIQYNDRRLIAAGHNSYPDNFEAFLEAVNTLLGGRKFR